MAIAPPPPPLRLSTRPLLFAAVALAAGIVAAVAWPRVPEVAWLIGGLLVAGLAVGYLAWSRRRLVTLRGLVLATAATVGLVCLGAARLAAWRSLPAHHVAHVAADARDADHQRDDRAPIRLWGTVADVPVRTSWSVRLVADVDSAERNGQRGAVRGRVQVSLMQPREGAQIYPALRPGDRVALDGRLETPPRRRNPAQMDYGAYLENQGIRAMLRIEDETGVAFLGPGRGLVTRASTTLRRHIRTAIARHVRHPESQSVLHALLLADRSRIEADALDTFRATGLMHLLAVSGLHIGLVGVALYVLLKPLLGRLGLARGAIEWGRACLTLLVLSLYVAVTGGSVSVERAFVMATVVIVGRAWERPADTLNALGAAAIVLLALRPTTLFDVGFQLSFGAVAALVTVGPLVVERVPQRIRQSSAGSFLVGSVAASVAATLGTAPALLAHFGRLPLGGLVLNVVAIPLTALTLAGGLGVAVCAGWFPFAAQGFALAADLGARGLLWTSRAGADGLGWASYIGFVDSPFAMAALVLALFAVALWRRPTARWRLGIASAALLTAGVWADVGSGTSSPTMDVVFLDVGQGDAALLRFPGGGHLLLDAGLKSPYVDEGERTILPHLERMGVSSIDALVLTHADADHIGGALAVLGGVTVRRLLHNGQTDGTDLWRRVLAVADSLGVSVEAVATGDTLAIDPSVRVRVLSPSPALAAAEPNDASVALLVQHGRTRWLLTGDAEAAGERDLVARHAAHLSADVVKVGHHGSETSSIPAFVAASGTPAYAVVSVARRNRYGLPDEAPLARWRATGAEVLLTSVEGAVWLRSDGEDVHAVDWR